MKQKTEDIVIRQSSIAGDLARVVKFAELNAKNGYEDDYYFITIEELLVLKGILHRICPNNPQINPEKASGAMAGTTYQDCLLLVKEARNKSKPKGIDSEIALKVKGELREPEVELDEMDLLG